MRAYSRSRGSGRTLLVLGACGLVGSGAVGGLYAAGVIGSSAKEALDTAPVAFRPLPSVPQIAEVGERQALEFPKGVDYPEAVRRIFIAQQTGGAPEGAVVVAPLPKEVVLLESEGRAGVTVSLASPFGWNPETGQVNLPSIAQSGSLSGEEVANSWKGLRPAAPWPAGSYVDVPMLPRCQVIKARSEVPARCTTQDILMVDFNKLRGRPLP